MTERTDRRGIKPGSRVGTDFEGTRGNLPHEVTDERREFVKRLAATMLSQAEIASVMEISPDTIQRHYADEFKWGRFNQGLYMREHAYRLAYGILKDPDDPSQGYVREPSEKMVMWALERLHGLVPETRNTHTIETVSKNQRDAAVAAAMRADG